MSDPAYLLVADDREYLVEPGTEFGTDLGVLEVPADVAAGDTVETHLGTPFEVRALRGPDLFAHLDRTGAPMMPRDIGLVVGLTGAAAGDRILDAGTGTGILAVHLGRIGASVTTYEIDPEFADVARENMVTPASPTASRSTPVTSPTSSLSLPTMSRSTSSPSTRATPPISLSTHRTSSLVAAFSSFTRRSSRAPAMRSKRLRQPDSSR